MPTFATPGPIAATVEVAGARVRVTATDRTDTAVLVEPIDSTNRSDVKVADKTKVEFADGRLLVKTTVSGSKEGSVAITIDLPTGSSLTVYEAHSALYAEGALGECDLHLATGRVQLDRIDGLSASMSSGEVAIGHIAGAATISGGAFALRIGEVQGPVGLTGSGGQVWIGRAGADLELSTSSGDLDIDRADGGVTAMTSSGAIRIGRMSAGRAKLTNGSGDIEVGISEGIAASIDVNSEKGAVHNFVSAQPEPGATDDKVSVFARTRRGDITIQRAAS